MMNRTIRAMTLLIVTAAIANSQVSKQAPNPNPKTEQEEVRAFHRELIEAHKKRDRAALERMIADGFIFIHSTGNWETRQEYIENAAAGALTSQGPKLEFEGLDEELRAYERHTAIVSGRSIIRDRGQNTENRLRG